MTLHVLHCLFLHYLGTWTAPHVTGTPPPPLECFTYTRVGQQAVLFGGYDARSHKVVNDVYTLDLEKWVGENVCFSDAQMRRVCV